MVAEESRAGYDRGLFNHWVDADQDGCDTRDEVLLSEADSPDRWSTTSSPIQTLDWTSLACEPFDDTHAPLLLSCDACRNDRIEACALLPLLQP